MELRGDSAVAVSRCTNTWLATVAPSVRTVSPSGPSTREHERTVEGVLLLDLDPAAGAEAELVEEGDDLGIGGAGHRDDGDVAGLEGVERGQRGDLAHLGLGDREAVGARRRAVEGDEEPVLDLLGQVVFEAAGEAVGLVPGVAEHVGEEALDDAVAADRGDRDAAADLGELDAAVGLVVDEAPVGEALDRGGDGRRRQPEPVGEVAGVGLGAARDRARSCAGRGGRSP